MRAKSSSRPYPRRADRVTSRVPHAAHARCACRITRSTGGKLAYLGGNGFYWRIARTQGMPHVIELRRAEGGIRAWAAEPGEYYHALDGEFGGLWRRNRRPPQMLAGVGFSGQGLFEGTHYRRLPASRDPAQRLDLRRHRG